MLPWDWVSRVLCSCSRLQASAVAFGESLAIPEIVAIGGQVGKVLLTGRKIFSLAVQASWSYKKFTKRRGACAV